MYASLRSIIGITHVHVLDLLVVVFRLFPE